MDTPSTNPNSDGLPQGTQENVEQAHVGSLFDEYTVNIHDSDILNQTGSQSEPFQRNLAFLDPDSSHIPHHTQKDTATTDRPPPECDDGGRQYESRFLQGGLGRQENSRDSFQRYLDNKYHVNGKPTVKSVKAALTKKGTAMMIGAMNAREKFISWPALHTIMSPETVCELLKEIFPKEKDLAIQYIHHISPTDFKQHGLRRIFALLIIIGKQNEILNLIKFDNDMNDSYLPVLDEHSCANASTHREKQFEEFFSQQDWDDDDVGNFRSRQWEVLPMFFANQGSNVLHYKCRSGEILPLTKHKNGIEKQGGFGEVTSYMLHEEQQSLERYTRGGAKHPIVVKKFKDKVTRDDFYRESSVLRRLTLSRHGKSQHLAKLLATFEIPKGPNATATNYYMMFECADMTLDDLFNKEPKQVTKKLSMSEANLHDWIALQVLGLARALHVIHHYRRGPDDTNDATHGVHGDLKPQNILLYHGWNHSDSFEDENQDLGRLPNHPGVLQITDFGQSSFHHTLTMDDIKFASLGGDYTPPELQLRLPVSASLDIWSLACLYLDMVTWLLKGPRGVTSFRKNRGTVGFLLEKHNCFYSVLRGEECTSVFVSDAVLEWATGLYGSQRGSDFTRSLLKLILEHMLVIEKKDSESFDNVEVSSTSKRYTVLRLAIHMVLQRNDISADMRPSIQQQCDTHQLLWHLLRTASSGSKVSSHRNQGSSQ
ncbi:hypothetical protein CcaCcLH18_01189 [Colletotrichum camelliae]|nr:hypothetical protein CcaCcLH18_01189 [Colletotrichum camelliae]